MSTATSVNNQMISINIFVREERVLPLAAESAGRKARFGTLDTLLGDTF